tara:strand:- start:46 stop:672 length:627 start_codon:yes stop_codon:yes gene_type:complete
MAFYMKMGSKSLKASSINMNGSPLPKVNCPDGTPPPCASQADADSKAQSNANSAEKKIINQSFTSKKIDDNTTQYTRTRDWIKEGKGKSTGTKSKDWTGDLAKMGFTGPTANADYNASKVKSGTESDTFTSTRLDPMPMVFHPAKITVGSPPPKNKPKKALPPGTNVPGKGRKKIKLKKPKISIDPSKIISKKKGGCPAGRKCKGAVN